MSISTWILSILGIVILGMLADMLMSDTRLQKYVRAIVSTFTVFIIIAPVPSFLRNMPNINGGLNSDPPSINVDNEFANRQVIRQYEIALRAALSQEGFLNLGVTIMGNREGISLIIQQVHINTFGLLEDDEANEDRIRLLVAGFLNVNGAVVVII